MIYLVRHGEASAGWGSAPDPGLSTLGKRQAEVVADTLNQKPLKRAFASPMQRCQETAAPFSRLSGQTIETDPRVTEIPTPDGLDDRVAWLQGFMAGKWDAAPAVVSEWRADLLTAIEAMPEDSVVFTHFIAINTIVGHLEGSDLVTNFRPGHCSVTQIEKLEGGLKLFELGSEAATKVL
ncbi:histidine phosphatase family protein [Henriciella litoralis]|uniref:histidine phosphatase family protein n=1 Tax=Henriciella litoralis TaxID=568102 RepID=UPI000A076305|nr:histidine phosphatase family protein [Henriciella litoralis]